MDYVEQLEKEEELCKLDVQLAQLLGYTDIHVRKWPALLKLKAVILMFAEIEPGVGRSAVDRWTKSDAAAFKLSVEHEINVQYDYTDRVIALDVGREWADAYYEDYTDKLEAARIAIVKAVILKKGGNI